MYICCHIRFFFFNDTATTEIYTLSLHDALPICHWLALDANGAFAQAIPAEFERIDRKSTRLNSSHMSISYAVFCLKKKKQPRHRELSGPAPSPVRRAPASAPHTSRSPPATTSCVAQIRARPCIRSCFFFLNDGATTEISPSSPTRRSSD